MTPCLVTQQLWPGDTYDPDAWRIYPRWKRELIEERWEAIHEAERRA